jgi:plasmid stability protein
MAKQLTIRGLPDEVATRLTKLSQERGKSVNAMIVEILKRAMDVHERRARLERYATWTDEDLVDFNEVLSAQRVIDEAIWH